MIRQHIVLGREPSLGLLLGPVTSWVSGLLHSSGHIVPGVSPAAALAITAAGGVAGELVQGGSIHARSRRVIPFLVFALVLMAVTSWYMRRRGWIVTSELVLPYLAALVPFTIAQYAVTRWLD